MYIVHFYENKTIVLSQYRETLPAINDPVKIKGRKGTVVDILTTAENKFHVLVAFEKEKIRPSLSKEIGKRRR
ncbi:hypothetical protein [Rummeliibacillus suwonensis]|uniref:hypothetical protein n=1 Tax=Rummeliibacillus suwonensis TaxID=1306154 RepID=UPI0011B54E5E|nr:hypothetical protein [Rummeliibacillus suwonensis]MBO2537130.1 hypothetical protein [Rummeliibacillus suwonensis]